MPAIFIVWNEEQQEFSHREYIGQGIDVPVFNTVTVTRRARYSNTVNQKMIARAHRWIQTDRPEGRVVIQ